MPAQKRSAETTTPPPSPPPPHKEEKVDDSLQDSENHSHEQTLNASDSDESSDSSGAEKDEFTDEERRSVIYMKRLDILISCDEIRNLSLTAVKSDDKIDFNFVNGFGFSPDHHVPIDN